VVDGIDLKVDRDGTGAVLRVTGEVDLTSAPRLDDEVTALIEGAVTDLTIELKGVSFMDSTGLRVLLKASKMIDSNGGKLQLAQPSDPVKRLLEVSGLDTHFTLS
jgi:anti-sigma B factor antagonist